MLADQREEVLLAQSLTVISENLSLNWFSALVIFHFWDIFLKFPSIFYVWNIILRYNDMSADNEELNQSCYVLTDGTITSF